jgi:3-deoxy-manno-octulosonate cytidylyltransferase (CMP-KDO synthetase)
MSAKPIVWAVIPARYGSTRFPGKPLALLGGKPMLQQVYERVRRTPSLARVLVATDDERILRAVKDFGGEAVLTGEQPSGTDRVHEAVRKELARPERDRGPAPDYVMNVQGDEPFIDPADLERLIQGMAAQPEAALGTLVFPIRDEAERHYVHQGKVVVDQQMRALYFSRAPIPHRVKSDYRGWRTMGVYLFRTAFLSTFAALPQTPLAEAEQLEQLRALEHGYPVHCFEAGSVSIGVDTPEDLERAEALLRG